MELKEWDPLESELPSDFRVVTIKKGISNILDSYTGWYDPICELTQNALDALDKRKEAESEYNPILWITIDLQNNQISVTDNGIGFKKDEFSSFLAPQVSFKGGSTRGNKGVGATYLAYGFNFLQVGTKTADFQFTGTIKDGREWIVDNSSTVPRPKVVESPPLHEPFNEINRGSTFTLRFLGKFIFPNDLTWPGATTAEQWKIVLLSKTPLGGIYFKVGFCKPKCILTVTAADGSTTTAEIDDCSYLFPHYVINSCQRYSDILVEQKKLLDRGKDPAKIPSKYKKLNGIYDVWSAEQISSKEFSGSLSDEERELAKHIDITCYGFFSYSTKIWTHFNDEIIKLRKGLRILRGGIQLASNYMPQGELHIIPLTKNIGYQHQCHVVAHFGSAIPDLGRKGYKPDIVKLAQKISTIIVSNLQNGRRFLRKDTTATPSITKEKEIHEWIKDQEIHEKDNPLIIEREDVFLPGKKPLITSTPLNEQDVIALFNQLLAGGVIRGVELLSTNQHAQYDGICRLILRYPKEHHLYSKESNPLGLEDSKVTEFISKPLVLEYKYSFDSLVEEFDNEEKRERDINIVVAWEMGNKWQERYEAIPILYLENIHHRYFHGETHLLVNSSTGDEVFPVIVLSELIEYINVPDNVQEYQKITYIES